MPQHNYIVCSPRQLPKHKWVAAAASAAQHNPSNHPQLDKLALAVPEYSPTKVAISVVTTKYWGKAGVKLSVSFLDNPPVELRKRILSHMNAWNRTANVAFAETAGVGEVRIARAGGTDGGYWSYVGTDIEYIAAAEPTMNLEGFTMETPDEEFYRVVRHETGHTLGCPHEHMRKELVNRIDRALAIEYFARTQGWSETMTIQQVLTPLEESSLLGTEESDETSIMCYQLPASITTDHQPILGGRDINSIDFGFMASCYPPATKVVPNAEGGELLKHAAAAMALAGDGMWSDDPSGQKLTVKLAVPGPIAQLWLYRVGGDEKSGQLVIANGEATPLAAPGTYRLLTRGKTAAPLQAYDIEITTPNSAKWKPNPARTSDDSADILDYHKVVIA